MALRMAILAAPEQQAEREPVDVSGLVEALDGAAEIIDILTSALPADHPLKTEAASRAKQRVSDLYALAAALSAHREQQGGDHG